MIWTGRLILILLILIAAALTGSAQDVTASFVSVPEVQTVKFGSEVIIPCRINETANICIWYKNEEELTLSSGKYEVKGDNGHGVCDLTISTFAAEDNGNYKCTVTAVHSSLESKPAAINGEAVVFSHEPDDKLVSNDENVTIACQIDAKADDCTWIKNNKELVINSGNVHIQDGQKENGSCDLTIINFKNDSNSGRYSCIVTSHSQKLYSKQASIIGFVDESVIFLKAPVDTAATYGSNVDILCEVNSTADVCTWIKDFELLKTEGDYELSTEQGSCSLTVKNFDHNKHNGFYSCIVKSGKNTLYSKQALITGIIFTKEPEDKSVDYGSDLTIPCRINDAADTCSWSKDNTKLQHNDSHYSITHTSDGGICDLKVSNFAAKDNGRYECKITVGLVAVKKSAEINVLKPVFKSEPQDEWEVDGTAVTISCMISAKADKCRWIKDNEALKIENEYTTVGSQNLGDCSLRITTFKTEVNQGQYLCIVKSDISELYSKLALINGFSGDKPKPVRFMKEPVNKIVSANSKVEIPCVISGSVDLCDWIKNSEILKINDDDQLSTTTTKGSCILTVKSFNSEKHNGIYSCVVKSGPQTLYSKQGEIRVLASSGNTLSFLKEPENQLVRYDSVVTIPCQINTEVDKCNWIKDGSELHMIGQYSMKDDSKKDGSCNLKITKFKMGNDGSYSCGVETGTDTVYSKSASIAVNTSVPDGPTMILNEFDPLRFKNETIVVDPKKSKVTITCSADRLFPLLPDGGNLTIYIDEVDIKATPNIVNSTKYPGTHDVTVSANLDIVKKTHVTCTLTHVAMLKEKSKSVLLIVPDSKFRLNSVNVSLIFPNDKKSLIIPNGEFSSDNTYKWFHLMKNDTWKEVSDRDSQFSLIVEASKTPGGVEKYKASLIQTDYFKVEIESEVTTVLTYEPLSETNITSPQEVKIKRGETATLHCKANGNPKPEIVWIKMSNGFMVEDGSGENKTVGKSIDDTGVYKCAAVQTIFERESVYEAYEAIKVTVE